MLLDKSKGALRGGQWGYREEVYRMSMHTFRGVYEYIVEVQGHAWDVGRQCLSKCDDVGCGQTVIGYYTC